MAHSKGSEENENGELPDDQQKILPNGHPGDTEVAPPRSEPTTLCSSCEALHIHQSQFIIAGPDQQELSVNLRRAASQHTSKGRSLQGAVLRSGGQDIPLGHLLDIQKKAEDCKLCALINKTVKEYSGPAIVNQHQCQCSLRWELDGRELMPSYGSTRTRRLRLRWTTDESRSKEAFLVLVARTDPLRPNSDASTNLSRGRHFLGKEIEQWKGKQALIKSWIDNCKQRHGTDCREMVSESEEFAKVLDETYFGVVDVIDMQLKPLPRDRMGRPAPYAALSYVWGRAERPYTTIRANVPLHQRHGGLELGLKQLPRTMQDAISLVQKLGLRYIWIDALCIVQDSPMSFRLNAQSMHTIYGNAELTLCAADGSDAWNGLVALHESPDTGPGAQLTTELPNGVRLQVSRPPEMVIQDSKWNTRAWTFQERILSRRCIIFAEKRVYFQCRTAAMSEDVHNEASGSSWSFQSLGAPLRFFQQLGIQSLSFYMNSVPQFYRRQLTQPRDILAAYSGIETVLRKVMRAPFVFGLPTSHLDFALLWQPLKAGIRRRPFTKLQHHDECGRQHGDACTCHGGIEDISSLDSDFAGLEFPSWSWSGWVGGELGYDTNMLEGPLLDVQEWLGERTWIDYHIRDGRGRLRPLWDRRKAEEDISLEPRWRGYAGVRTMRDNAVDGYDVAYSSSDDAEEQVDAMKTERRTRHRRRSSRQRENTIRPSLRFLRMPAEPVNTGPSLTIFDDATYPNREWKATRERYRDDDFERQASDEIIVKETVDDQSVIGEQLDLQHRTVRPLDAWGRTLYPDPQYPRLRGDRFGTTLPENPFGVNKATFTTRPSTEFPDMPILQFWTFKTSLQVVIASSDSHTQLSRCHVGDSAGDWCGSVVLNTDWIAPKNGGMFDFIALSKAKTFTQEEHPVWTYYVPSERSESAWQVYHVLLVEWDNNRHFWERVGIGKVFMDAFLINDWKEVVLG